MKAVPAAQYPEPAMPLEELLHASQLKRARGGGGQLVQQI